MVRNFPSRAPDHCRGNNPLLSRSFAFAFLAATIAIVSLLCGTKKRRRPPPSQNRPTRVDEDSELATTYVKVEDKNDDIPDQPPEVPMTETEIKELPIPPRMASLRASSYHVGSTSNTSQRAKLTSSMSMRLPGGLKGFKKGSKSQRYDDGKQDTEKLTREDSVWKKAIILGERCRIPDEDDEDIVYDEDGRRVPTFHRKQSGNLTISQQSSGINQDEDQN